SLEHADVDRRGLDRERIVESALRNTAHERGLSAFELATNAAAGVLALRSATGGFAETGSDAASGTALFAVGAGGLCKLAQCIGHDSIRFFDMHEVHDLLDRAAERRRVLDDDLGARTFEAET